MRYLSRGGGEVGRGKRKGRACGEGLETFLNYSAARTFWAACAWSSVWWREEVRPGSLYTQPQRVATLPSKALHVTVCAVVHLPCTARDDEAVLTALQANLRSLPKNAQVTTLQVVLPAEQHRPLCRLPRAHDIISHASRQAA